MAEPPTIERLTDSPPAQDDLALPFDEREVVLRANLSDVDEEGCLWVSLRFMRGPTHPREGDTVYLLDPDGGGSLGEVVLLNGWVARVKPAEPRRAPAEPRRARRRGRLTGRQRKTPAVPHEATA